VNWFWLNIPLMTVFFVLMTGIPLWLVFKHPDRSPAPERPGQARSASMARRHAAVGVQTQPMAVIKLRAGRDGDEYAVPSLVQAGR
jgi:hypothetical protein